METTVIHIGNVAQELLTHEQNASLLGVTSRGLFLHLTSGWVIFLSTEAQRGPLTLNCAGLDELLKRIEKGEQASVIPGKIIFPAMGVTIDLSQASPWHPPPLPGDALSPELRKTKLREVAALVHARQPASPLAGLLPVLTGCEQGLPPPAFAPQVAYLLSAVPERRPAEIVAGLAGILGMGVGLTPCGDDLVLGFLLALARWGRLLAQELPAADLARELLPLAYRKTTTLSANLLECASRGQADERLLFALDGILSVAPDPPACAAALAAWGNTSGHDALVGMALLMHEPR